MMCHRLQNSQVGTLFFSFGKTFKLINKSKYKENAIEDI